MRTSAETLRLITPEQSARLSPGLRILLESFNNAAAARRKAWDFAGKRETLRAAGLIISRLQLQKEVHCGTTTTDLC
jgi:hypothetical protein